MQRAEIAQFLGHSHRLFLLPADGQSLGVMLLRLLGVSELEFQQAEIVVRVRLPHAVAGFPRGVQHGEEAGFRPGRITLTDCA